MEELFTRLAPEDVERMADCHGLEPHGERPWVKHLTGGSDDHGGFYLGTTWTETPEAATVEEKEAVEAIWPEAVPGAMAAPSAAASEPGREVLPAEELLEELTSALRAARDLSPHLCGSSLASMLGKILDDWLGWAARCPELDEGDRVEVCVALKELSQGVPTAGDFAGIYQYFSGRLRDLEVLHRPVWGDRKPLGKFELLGNLSLGL